MSKSKSRKFADILSGNLATVLDDGIISASEVASLGTAATTDATAYATAAQGTTADNALPKSGGAMTGAITTNSTFDGRDIATDGAKLDGIETGATADQTAAQILTAIKTVDGASSGLDADLLDGQQGSYYTNYADTAVANLADSAPLTLNTLNELAAALGDDANFSTTVTNSIATKLPLAGGTMSGDIDGNGNKVLFANVYSSTNDLPSASTYHGMFAHVHGTGKGYFAHAGSWIPLANETATLALSGGAMTGAITTNSTFDGRDVSVDGAKLDTIETNATADQTDAEIRAAVEAATDSNVFTDADHSKLNAIEANADVTDTANVVSALTAGSNITIAANGTISSTDTNTTYSVQDGELSENNFTDADHTKLNSIETNADVTDTTNVVAALTAGTNVNIASNGTISSTNTTYSVGDGGLTQKNFTTTLKSKLDGIESGATGDQSASEISGLEEFVEDQIGANIIGGTNVSVSYNDSTGQTTLSSTDTNTTYSAGGGLGLSGTTFSHNDTSSQASVNNSGRTYIQDITLDTYGHITGITSATETVVNTNTTYTVGDGGLTQKNFTSTLKNKLDGIATSANNYSHPTGAGNKHIPSGGSSGQILQYASSGTAQWTDPAGGASTYAVPNWGSPQATYTSNTTWTKPSSIGDDDWVTFYLVGGGGSGYNWGTGYSQGGMGGAAYLFTVHGSAITSSISIVIGAGGPSAAFQSIGNAGGNTTITHSGVTLTASGGLAGNGQSNSNNTTIGHYRIPDLIGFTNVINDVSDVHGGRSAFNSNGFSSVYGGAGAGGYYNGERFAGTSTYGGNGGSANSAGSVHGGGGGGGYGGGGYAGGSGSVRIYY